MCKLVHYSFFKLPFFLTLASTLAQIWLLDTIMQFTRFGGELSFLIFLGFVFLNFISFTLLRLFVKVFAHLKSLSLSLAIFIWELLPMQLFRWKLVYLFSSMNFIPLSVSVFGSSFISMLITLFFSFLVEKKFRSAFFVGALLILIEIYGTLGFPINVIGNLSATLIQPNHSLNDKHSIQHIPNLIKDFNQLINNSLKTDLIIYPESIFYYFYSTTTTQIFEDPVFSRIFHNKSSIIGALTTDSEKFFNSILFFSDEGDLVGTYHKEILMPFGEFMPLRDYLQSVLKFHPIEDFSIGANNKPVLINGFLVSSFICYEDIFERYVKQKSENVDILVVVSNDLWFGRSVAPYLHERFASFRAIELGRILIRVSNSGYSSITFSSGGKFFLPPNEKISKTFTFNVTKRDTLYYRLPIYFEFILIFVIYFVALVYRYILDLK